MKKIEIHCPECRQIGRIEIDENNIGKSSLGITAINVAGGLICPHSFEIYLDNNLNVTDCSLAESILTENSLTESIFTDWLTNLQSLWLTYIITGCFYKKKILVLNDIEFLDAYLRNFFDYIFRDSFEIEITFLNKKIYGENKKKYENYLIIDNDTIVNDPDKIIETKKLKIGKIIVHNFLADKKLSPTSSLIIIKKEILKAYLLSKEIIDFNNQLGEKEEFTSKRFVKYLNKKFYCKIRTSYLNFLMEIAKNYFEFEPSEKLYYYYYE